MKRRGLILLALSLLAACRMAGTGQVDQKKFESLFLAGKDVEADLSSNAGLRGELLRRLKSEASMAESRASNDAERGMIRLYADAASMLLFSETMRESELATGRVPASSGDSKSSERFRRIGIEKLNLARQTYLGK